MATNNITGVRGNHDQKVIEWRGWVERVLTYDGGQEWLEKIERMKKSELKAELAKLQKSKDLPTWKRIPKSWKIMGEHYQISR